MTAFPISVLGNAEQTSKMQAHRHQDVSEVKRTQYYITVISFLISNVLVIHNIITNYENKMIICISS